MNEDRTFHVTALWDDDARVFTSQSDIPGLVIEAETFDAFVDLVRDLAADIIAANLPGESPPYRIDVAAHRPVLLQAS